MIDPFPALSCGSADPPALLCKFSNLSQEEIMTSSSHTGSSNAGDSVKMTVADELRRKVSIASAASSEPSETPGHRDASSLAASLQEEVLSLQLQLQKEKDEKSELAGQLKTARIALMNLAKVHTPFRPASARCFFPGSLRPLSCVCTA